jgi:hypothetical protein
VGCLVHHSGTASSIKVDAYFGRQSEQQDPSIESVKPIALTYYVMSPKISYTKQIQ